jgi:hypothetical protein
LIGRAVVAGEGVEVEVLGEEAGYALTAVVEVEGVGALTNTCDVVVDPSVVAGLALI